MSVSKINGISLSSIDRRDGIRINSDVANVNGITVSSFSNTKSLITQGTNDYIDFDLSSLDLSSFGQQGSVSTWLKVGSTANTATTFFWSIYDADATAQDRIELQFFNTSGNNVFALNGMFRNKEGSSYPTRVCNAKTGSSHHGKPWNRIASDYGDFGSASDSVYNAHNMRDTWMHVVWTWHNSATYTYDGTTYTGRQRIYVNGTLRNEGSSSFASHNGTGTALGLAGVDSATTLDKIRIGARFNANNDYQGLTDEVAMFNGEINQSTVTSIYNSGVPGDISSTSGLIAWFRFEDNTNESVSGSNLGSLQGNATYSSTVPS